MRDEINSECSEIFEFGDSLESIIEESILPQINIKKSGVKDDNDKWSLDYTITLLLGQAIKTYKSSILLIKEGYSTNALVNLRNLVEIIFNLDYILESKKNIYKRAKKYLSNKKNWSNKKVWERAELSLNKGLYKAYQILCEYSHANYIATCRNDFNGQISIGPSDNLAVSTAIFVNSVYYYFLYSICEYYDLDINYLEEIIKPSELETLLKRFRAEKDVVATAMDIIKEMGLQSDCVLEQYKDFKIAKKK